MSSDSQWFYSDAQKKQQGPVSFAQLQQLAAVGQIQPDSLVWNESMPNWTPAAEVSGLLPEGAAPSAPASQSTNPYATPATSNSPAVSAASMDYQIPTQPIPLDIGFCFKQAWKHTLNNFGTIFLFGLCYFVILYGVGFLLAALAVMVEGEQQVRFTEAGQVITESKGPFSLLMDLVNWIVTIFLGLGATRWGFRFLDGDNPPISELFSQGSKLFTAIVASILFGFAVVIGFILLIIPGIILALRLGFYQQAIVEKNLGILESLKYSWKLTRQNGFSLFGFAILSLFIGLAGLLALLIGLIWAIPTIWLAYLIAFRFLHNGQNSIRVLP